MSKTWSLRITVASCLGAAALLCAVSASAHTYVPPAVTGRAPALVLRIGEDVSPYPLMSAFVLPGETLPIEVLNPGAAGDFLAEADGGSLTQIGSARWSWRAPMEPGFHRISILDSSSGAGARVQVFVLTPYRGQSVFNGFRVGRYQSRPKDGDPAYRRPRGMVEVTPDDLDVPVSPHFRLGDFLCKQESSFPKYLVLRTQLLVKLELLQDLVTREEGPEARVRIMSAYRTPYYNASIGNRTRYSRHLYGDAADVFIDRNGDETMDDVNGDGRVNTADAAYLFRLVEEMGIRTGYITNPGGIGLYGPRRGRGPFVHVDARGYEVRWGDRRGERWLRAHRQEILGPLAAD